METPLDINDPGTLAEVLDAFGRYEAAVEANDVATLNALFWHHDSTLRYGYGENLYGVDAIHAFRQSRTPSADRKVIGHRVITTFGTDFATANIDFTRGAKRCRQSQTWIRTPEGWRIAAAHVSHLDEPADKAPLADARWQGQVRRIVTGHDAQGQSLVASDAPAPHVRINPARPGHYSTDLWRTNETPARISASLPEPTGGPRKITPNPNGSVLRISVIPPDSESLLGLDAEAARRVFADMGEAHASTFQARRHRHPLIHRTQTIDYAILLEGELHMVLDEGEVALRPGDVVVQAGTNHAWSNRSGKPARIAYVLLDGKFDEDLATHF